MKVKKVLNSKNSHIIFGFLIPVLFFIFLWILYGMYPIKTYAMAPYDAKHQYLSFLQEYRNKLISGEGLFFSKRMDSTDFYTEWLYYLTSPFNLIVLFFKDIILAFEVLVVLKIGCIGASMAAFLKKKYGGGGINTAVFACVYALSSYVMSYYFSIMWLDILMIFPWLIYSFELLMGGKNYWLYPVLLGFVIYSNFFMAMHVCIFLVLYFLFSRHRNFIKDGIRFSLCSLLGGGIGAAFFMPFFTLLGDKQGEMPGAKLLCGFDELIMGFGTLAKKQVSMDYTSNANLYCGLITFILFLLFLTNKKFPKDARIKTGILCLILFLCTNIACMDFIINGFYKTKGYMGRYSYIIIFLLVCAAYQEFGVFRQESLRRKLLVIISCIIIFGTAFTNLVISQKVNESYIYNIAATIIVLLWVFIFFYAKASKSYIAGLLLIEVIFTGFYGFKASDLNVLKQTMDDVECLYTQTDARSTILDMEIHNEEVLNGLNGLSLFSSSLPEVVSSPQYRVGLRGGSNYVTAIGCELFPSLLYNIQYIYGSEDEYLGFEKIKDCDGRSLFKNTYKTAYAYRVPGTLKNWGWETINSFNNINAFISFFVPGKFFTIVPQNEVTYTSDYESTNPYLSEVSGAQRIEFTKGLGTYLSAEITAERPEIALIINHGWFNVCQVYINDELYMSDDDTEGDIIYLKEVKAGDKIKVYVDSRKESGSIGIMFAYYDMEVYNTFADEMASRIIEVSFDDNRISGNYELKDGEAVFLSVPNIDGWEINTGGHTEPEDFPFIMFVPDKKSGHMELHYITPLFLYGLCISVVSLIIVFVLIWCYIKNKRKREKFHVNTII